MKSLKLILSLLIVFFLGSFSIAGTISDVQVDKFNQKMNFFFSSMKGVVGMGVQTCDLKSGELISLSNELSVPSNPNSTESCSVIYFETKEFESAFKYLFPINTRLKGVLISTQVIGKIEFQ